MEFRKIREENAVDAVIEKLKAGNYRKAKVKLGEIIGNPVEFMKLFEYLTKGTGLEGTKLKIKAVPSKVDCFYCDWKGRAELHESGARCPRCSRDVMILQGNELEIHL